jgi:glutamate dehydrogenase/leucine dehydrogenase
MLQNLISSQIDKALEVFQNKYNDELFEKIIRNPEKKIHVTFTHNNELYDGFRVQYNSILGPYKGGIRIDPIVTEEECTALAFWMTIKTALFNLPYGGGKGGIKANFKNMSLHFFLNNYVNNYPKNYYKKWNSNTFIKFNLYWRRRVYASTCRQLLPCRF